MLAFRRFERAIDGGIGRRKLGHLVIALIIAFFLWFPNDTSQSNYAKTVFISGFFYAIMSSSWALLAGIAGQFSFGHMAFMGIGAYVAGLIARDGVAFAMLGVRYHTGIDLIAWRHHHRHRCRRRRRAGDRLAAAAAARGLPGAIHHRLLRIIPHHDVDRI